jgi:hypothetical protein
METSVFVGKSLPCPVCNAALRLKLSQKEKPYCMCLDCGIQIFFRGQAGIERLRKLVESDEAVAAEFTAPARAVSLYNRLQELKRKRRVLEGQQGLFFRDKDRDHLIAALDSEIEHVRESLEKEAKTEKAE